MSKTGEARVGLGRAIGIALGIAGFCLAGLMLFWSGPGSATKHPEEGRAMGQSSAATATTAARPPIDLAVPAGLETATFALG